MVVAFYTLITFFFVNGYCLLNFGCSTLAICFTWEQNSFQDTFLESCRYRLLSNFLVASHCTYTFMDGRETRGWYTMHLRYTNHMTYSIYIWPHQDAWRYFLFPLPLSGFPKFPFFPLYIHESHVFPCFSIFYGANFHYGIFPPSSL